MDRILEIDLDQSQHLCIRKPAGLMVCGSDSRSRGQGSNPTGAGLCT